MKGSALRRIFIILGILIGIFAIINLAWLFMIKLPYEHYCERSEKFCTSSKFTSMEEVEMYFHTYYDDEMGYGYKIYQPSYLRFIPLTLAIGDNRHVIATINAETGEITSDDPPLMRIDIIRNAFGSYAYLLNVTEPGGNLYGVKITRDFEILYATSNDTKTRTQELIDQNIEHLRQIMDYAAEMWELP